MDLMLFIDLKRKLARHGLDASIVDDGMVEPLAMLRVPPEETRSMMVNGYRVFVWRQPGGLSYNVGWQAEWRTTTLSLTGRITSYPCDTLDDVVMRIAEVCV